MSVSVAGTVNMLNITAGSHFMLAVHIAQVRARESARAKTLASNVKPSDADMRY